MSISDVVQEDRLLLADGSYATVLGHVGMYLMAQVECEGSTVFTVLDWTEAADKYAFMAVWRRLRAATPT